MTFTDELMAELMNRLPRDVCLDVLRATLIRSRDSLLAYSGRNRRSDAYKAQMLACNMAARIGVLPKEKDTLLSESAEDITVEPLEGGQDEFATLADDIPEFKQYASVFKQYPYVELKDVPGLGQLVVLGFCSGRGKTSNKLYRRNCLLVMPDGKRINFRELGSAIGVLQDTGPDGIHYTIKAVPYADGMAVKFWTNLIGERDVPDQYRYLFLHGVPIPSIMPMETEVQWETHQHKYRAEKDAEAKRQALEADIAPAPITILKKKAE
jgi:hypothetical protein